MELHSLVLNIHAWSLHRVLKFLKAAEAHYIWSTDLTLRPCVLLLWVQIIFIFFNCSLSAWHIFIDSRLELGFERRWLNFWLPDEAWHWCEFEGSPCEHSILHLDLIILWVVTFAIFLVTLCIWFTCILLDQPVAITLLIYDFGSMQGLPSVIIVIVSLNILSCCLELLFLLVLFV